MKYVIALATLLAVVVGSQAWCFEGGDLYMPNEVKNVKDGPHAGQYCKCTDSQLHCGACSAMGEVFDGKITTSNGMNCVCGRFGQVGCTGKRSVSNDEKREFAESSIKSLMALLKKNKD